MAVRLPPPSSSATSSGDPPRVDRKRHREASRRQRDDGAVPTERHRSGETERGAQGEKSYRAVAGTLPTEEAGEGGASLATPRSALHDPQPPLVARISRTGHITSTGAHALQRGPKLA